MYVHERDDRLKEDREEEIEDLDRAWQVDIAEWNDKVDKHEFCVARVNSRNELRQQTLDEYELYTEVLPRFAFIWVELTRTLNDRIPALNMNECEEPGPRPEMPPEVKKLRERKANGD